MLELKPIRIGDKALFDAYLNRAYQETSELTFTNLFVWRERYSFRYTILHDCLIICAMAPKNPFILFPIGYEECGPDKLRLCVDELKMFFSSLGSPLEIRRASGNALKTLAEAGISHHAERDEANDDYIYRTEDLATLRGKKYDGKRNHIRRLAADHATEYRAVTQDNLKQAKSVIEEWFALRSQGKITSEPEWTACMELIGNYRFLECSGGILIVDGKPAAVTFGERLNTDTAVIHFEKAAWLPDGTYPLINQSYVQSEWRNTVFINREQDLGIKGLRYSKQSYHPIRMVEKYNLTV